MEVELGAIKQCDVCMTMLTASNTKNQRRLEQRKQKDKAATRAKNKKLRRLVKRCEDLESRLKVYTEKEKNLYQTPEALLKEMNAHLIENTNNLMDERENFSSNQNEGKKGDNGNAQVDVLERKLTEFVVEQIHNSRTKPRGRRFSSSVLNWCVSIYLANKKAFREFVRNSPGIILPAERTIQQSIVKSTVEEGQTALFQSSNEAVQNLEYIYQQ